MNPRLEERCSAWCPSLASRRAFWTLIRQMVLLLAIGLIALAGSHSPAIAAGPRDVPASDLPCLLRSDAPGVIVLFSGKAEELAQNFTQQDGTAPTWKILDDGSLQAQDASIMTKRGFGDCQLHIEFKTPLMAEATGQARGNSGIVLHGRFEMQILDSFGISQPGTGDCGAVYNVQAPLVNACKAPNEWQSYDILFRAPRFSADGKTRLQTACVTAFLNGVLVQNNTEIPRATGNVKIGDNHKPAPFLLQYRDSAVEFRNIWVLSLSPTGAAEAPAPQAEIATGPAPEAEIATGSGVLKWQDMEEGKQIPVERVLFDQGGYQVHCGNGETIVVPFANENLNVMKFGRSSTDNAYFVNDGSTPTLYLSNGGYLESAVAQDTRWYPFASGYNYTSPVYVGLAPTWRDYATMGWYNGMEVYGGAVRDTRGDAVWMTNYYTLINKKRYPTYRAYRVYLTDKPTYARNRVILNYALRPTPPRNIVRSIGNPVNGGTRSGSSSQPGFEPVSPPNVHPGTRSSQPAPPRRNQPGLSQSQRGASRVPSSSASLQRLPFNRPSQPMNNYRPPVNNYRPPVNNYRPPVNNYRPPVNNYRPAPGPARNVPNRRRR